MSFLLQLEDGNDFLNIYEGGRDDAKIMIANLTGTMNGTKISIPGNQMFVIFKTNKEMVGNGFYALIMKSKYFKYLKIILNIIILYL